MKVAIIGAGVSGLACAYEFERNGVTPVVFERKSHLGQDFNFTIAYLSLFNRTYTDPVKVLKKKYGLSIKPLYNITEEIMIGPTKKYSVKGNLGYVFKRGEEPFSLENQLAKNSNIYPAFDSYISVKDIKKDFDYIVVATGDSIIAKELGVWTTSFNCHTRIATALGDFKVGSAKIWFNTEFCKNGFCFMLPDNKDLAHFALTVNNITHSELDFYWKEFLFKQQIRHTIIETNDHEETIGFAQPVQLGKIYFIGNTAGMIDNFLGFGAFNGINSGILAARSILFNLPYSNILKPIIEDVKDIGEYRKAINTFENKDYDRLLSLVNLPIMKQLIYKNPLYKAKLGVPFAKLYNSYTRK